MSNSRFPKLAEQVAGHLRAELCRGRWTVDMPGRHEVAAELGVSPQTAKAALALLEREGLTTLMKLVFGAPLYLCLSPATGGRGAARNLLWG